MKEYGEFYDLEVWKEARKLRQMVSALTKKFPREEVYVLTQQVTKSSRSVSANIAESHGRHYKKELTQFQRYSKGSLKETLDHMFVALDEQYITQEEFDALKVQYELVKRLLNGYIGYIQRIAA